MRRVGYHRAVRAAIFDVKYRNATRALAPLYNATLVMAGGNKAALARKQSNNK